MADETPKAPAEQPVAPASEATNTNPEPAQAPAQEPEINAEQVAKYLGTDKETLEKFTKFTEANGNFNTAFKKLRTDVSTPEQKPEAPAQQPEQPTQPEQKPAEPAQPQAPPTPPAGAITADEMMTQYYFEQLSKQEAYKPIAKEIADGSLLKEMSALGIEIRNPDGSFNDAKINTYLGIKAQTVPATQPSSEPDASNAPLNTYTPVGEKITSMEQARTVLSQAGHPQTEAAREYLKQVLNPGSAGQKPESDVK